MSSTTTTLRAAVTQNRSLQRLIGPYAFVAPMMIVVLLLFLYPLVQMAASTLFVADGDGVTRFTIDPFVQLLSTERGMQLLWRTLRISLMTTIATLVLAYPVTLWLRETGPRLRGFVIVLLLSPMLTSDVVRSLGWVSILGPRGAINEVLQLLGLPEARILYTEGAVVIGLTQIFLGYMVLSLLSSILRIPDDLVNAAANLGATRRQILGRIVLPMSVPGIAGGCAIVFPLAASTYVTAALLGGTSNPVLGTELYREALVDLDWGSASAIGIVMFAIIVVVMALVGVIARIASRRVRS